MTAATNSSLRLLEDCLIGNDDAAWRAFLDRHEPLWKGLCPEEDWLLWLPGWLFARRRIQQTWKAVERFRQDRIEVPDPEVEAYLENYLRDVFRTGKAEFQKEQRRHWSPDEWLWRELPAREDSLPAESLDEVETWLREEPLHRRVPFRLRHWRVLAPLAEGERLWLAGLAGVSPDLLDQRIREKHDAHPAHQFPLGSQFIGGLMGISAALVDQRVRQVLLDMRRRGAKEGHS